MWVSRQKSEIRGTNNKQDGDAGKDENFLLVIFWEYLCNFWECCGFCSIKVKSKYVRNNKKPY